MGWRNLPVSTSGVGPVTNNQAAPTDWSSYEFFEQFCNALEEKDKLGNQSDCSQEFPPPSQYFTSNTGGGSLDTVTDNGDGTLTFKFSNVAWAIDPASGCTGTKWAISCGDCLGYIPASYDLIAIADYADAYTWLRLPINSNTFDSNTSTGTITTPKLPALNAVTANFISSIASLAGSGWRILKRTAGLTSRDRRPLKPNQREYWRGNVVSGWIDSSGNGQIHELTNSIDPSPYDTDGGTPPAVDWPVDYWKDAKPSEALFFDSTGLLYRASVSGNDATHLGFNQSIYQVTVNAISGTFSLSFTPTNLSGGTIAPAFNASAATLQTDLAAFPGMSGQVTVSGAGPFTVSFDASLGFVNLNSSGGALIGPPPGAVNLSSGAYLLCGVGDKGMPGRIPDAQLAWYTDIRQPYRTHLPSDSMGSANKPVYTLGWAEGNVCAPAGCTGIEHDVLFADAQYEIDNNCEPARAGDWVSPNHYKNWGNLQRTALGKLGNFVDLWNPWGDFKDLNGPNLFTPATWAVGAQANYRIALNAWSSTLSVSANTGTGTLSVPVTAPAWPLSVYYTVQSVHQVNKKNGTGSIDASGVITGGFDTSDDGLTIFIWPGNTRTYRRRHKYNYPKAQWIADCATGGCEDPPAITPGGALDNPAAPTLTLGQGGTLKYNQTYGYVVTALNGSGETNASGGATIVATQSVSTGYNTSAPITTNTYNVVLNWTPELGASSYNIYGRNSGSGKLFLANVSAYTGTWTDDGSITPSGAAPPVTNTTSTDCFGTGFWNFRQPSAQHLSVSTDGMVSDGGGGNLSTGVISCYTGDNASDPFTGRGPLTASLDDASYWDGFYRGHYHKSLQTTRTAHQSGDIVFGNKYSIFDPSAAWWVDGLNDGTLRVQGGNFNAGSSTTVTDTNYNNSGTSKSCWFSPARFVGAFNGIGYWNPTAATPYSFFAMEIYSGGTPAGWTFVEDGTATYAAPTATGHSGTYTNGSSPSISGMTPALIHATGFAQPVFIQGNNFSAGCTVQLTSPDLMTILPLTPSTVTAGELTLSATFDRDLYGSWHAVVINPGGLSSAAFAFDVNQMQAVPVQSFATGVFSLAATLASTANAGDGYLIREAKYELNRHAGRVVRITPDAGDVIELVCRFSDNSGLYFDQQSSALQGSYKLKEIDTGAKMQLSSGKPTVAANLLWCEAPPTGTTPRYWVQPAGADPRGGTFRKDINCNLETKATDFGFFTLLDDFGKSIPDELYYMIKPMQWTTESYHWTANGMNNSYGSLYGFSCTSGSPAPGATNCSGNNSTYSSAFDSMKSNLIFDLTGSSDSPPGAGVTQTTSPSWNFGQATGWDIAESVAGQFSFGQQSNPCLNFPCTIEFYWFPDPPTGIQSFNYSSGTIPLTGVSQLREPCDPLDPYDPSLGYPDNKKFCIVSDPAEIAPNNQCSGGALTAGCSECEISPYEGPGVLGQWNLWDTEANVPAGTLNVITAEPLGGYFSAGDVHYNVGDGYWFVPTWYPNPMPWPGADPTVFFCPTPVGFSTGWGVQKYLCVKKWEGLTYV